MMYYRISKNEKILFFGKKIAQVWAVTLSDFKLNYFAITTFLKLSDCKDVSILNIIQEKFSCFLCPIVPYT